MQVGNFRVLFITIACLTALMGCQTTSNTSDPLTPGADPLETGTTPDLTGAVPAPKDEIGAAPELLGEDSHDDLSIAKKYFRQGGFGLAEQYFRKAVETHPRNAEAWLGLAASYDRLRRFDLADRAYAQVIKLIGRTAEVLNNQGYSYLLRGDYRRARAILLAAKAKSPDNPYIQSNLELLAESQRKAKTVN
jgi:Flp pilus assembly protein TadD